MMDKYISIEAAIKELCVGKVQGVNTIRLKLNSIPPADVVPVVKCKDCRYYEEHHYELEGEPPYIKGKCGNKFGLNRQYMVHPEEFCSRGERRE